MSERQTVDQVIQKLNKGEPLTTEEQLVLAAAIRDLKKDVDVLKKQYREFKNDKTQSPPRIPKLPVAPEPLEKSDKPVSKNPWWAFWRS